ncbi:MAG: M20/M25/M40 family metallo-hydrolase [Candidatus Abyssobacteria bacterium SURF_17]|uniref:M20/M25/M40 family metallo-hydrolase n=1 Tax=Candidatus Abyssobacteria bacterium SURF_17 TaxID=2093361 RepID=A0A419F5W9_9BACT|nr:MAG: M20/M25/M40 family metallo-hydrolase [Candidatus Abyssubacteria bacterium SURF_17]
MNEIDWRAVTDEATGYLIDLVKFNTTNPPGNELECATYVSDLLAKEGIDPLLLESVPKRGNVVARLRGDGSRKPLLLMSHLDVVPADSARWEVPPFSGEVRNGEIWGRGTLDTKGLTVMHLMAMFLLKRNAARLKRDIIFMANADEETGGKHGAQWMVDNHFDKIAAEFALNEGGFGMKVNGKTLLLCANAEKGMTWAKLTAKGHSGHGSMPHSDNAVLHMVRAAKNIAKYRPPIVVTDSFRKFADALAKHDTRGHLLKLMDVPGIGRIVLALVKDDRVRVMVQSTITPTVIKGGVKVNVIPDYCELELDCRLLPGVTRDVLEKTILALVNSDKISLEFVVFNEASESSIDTELFSTLEQVLPTSHPEAVVSSFIMPGGTDSRFVRTKGVSAYGLIPIILEKEDIASIHGDNEKISIENLSLGLRTMHNVVASTCL